MKTNANENKLLATVYLNLRGNKKKRQDWIEIARAVDWAVAHYGSVAAAAEKLGYSYELVRTIRSLLTLPEEVQAEIRKGRILYDAAQRLARVKDAEQQRRIASTIVGMSSHDARQVIQLAKRFPKRDPQMFRKQVEHSKGRTRQVHVVILPLSPELYKKLAGLARERELSVEKLILGKLGDFAVPGGSPNQ